MKVLYYPKYDGNNYSVRIFRDCLESAGNKVVEFQPSIKKLLLSKYDMAYIQWYENLPNGRVNAIKMVVIKLFLYYLLKINDTKITYVIHNKVSHDESVYTFSRFVMKFLIRRADKIIILSDETINEIKNVVGMRAWGKIQRKSNIFKIPHPNYINVYKKGSLSHFAVLKHNTKAKFVIMCMGMVRPYKNIEVLIKAFIHCNLASAQLLIVGKPQPYNYGEELKEMASCCSNISFVLQFIQNDEMYEILDLADIMVMPYNKRSCLNSGAMYLAFSYGKTVIAPPIGTALEFRNNSNDMYLYNYDEEIEQIDKLSEAIIMAYNDWKNNNKEFYDKGKRLYEEVKLNNSSHSLIEAYKQIFEN